ncbi:hypothetical protein J6590_076933 [Homalodisca vitripennis]|nr:hypothetical protein J6590_076933 [Homalodisca vitripennis]
MGGDRGYTQQTRARLAESADQNLQTRSRPPQHHPRRRPSSGQRVSSSSPGTTMWMPKAEHNFQQSRRNNLNCRITSKILITPLFLRHDLLPDSHIQETIRVANAYICELCVRSEGEEMLGISRIGQQFFTSHGQHLRESGQRLLTSLMTAHLATMASDTWRQYPPVVAAPSHPLPTAKSRTEGGTNADLQEIPKQPRMSPF